MLVLANRLSEQLNKRRINWKDVESIIQENRAYINEYDDDDCALSDLYGYFYKNGKQALMLTELFLKHGFDVNANDGKNGASCLHQLCWSLYDQYVVEIAERLLDIGANPNIGMDDEDEHGILDSIGWKLGYWMTGDYEEANMFEAYYLLAERAQSGKKYSGIRAFRNSVGSIVEKVEKIKYAQDTDEGKKRRIWLEKL